MINCENQQGIEDRLSNAQPIKDQRKRFISFDEIIFLCDNLYYELKKVDKVFNSIYGLPRGGMVPAVMLSHRLNLPIVENNGINPGTIIIDDIVDSGKELSECKRWFYNRFGESPYFISIFKREGCDPEPYLFGEEIKNDDWLVFPWEIY